jgi:hypothetical protein
MKKEFPIIIPFTLLSIFALFAGLWAGLIRMGWQIPMLVPALAAQHGPLMISGFLGTLISLERVAALRQRWMFTAPFFSGSGWLLSLIFPKLLVGPFFILAGSLVMTGILIVIVRRETKLFTVMMMVGAFSWFGGNLLWVFGTPVSLVIWWWAAFLVLTIAGERLELNRVLRLRNSHIIPFAAAAAVFLVGAVIYPEWPLYGAWLTGLGMLALSIWMLIFDIARRNLRHPNPITRYIAVCLFTGYFWLGFTGILNMLYGPQFAGPLYDAVLHSVFVGFVFSMIFGHAPIIFPALTQITIPFRPVFYLPLILLHASLILRIAGDLAYWSNIRKWGGLLNETAILAFIAVFAYSIVRQKAANRKSSIIKAAWK